MQGVCAFRRGEKCRTRHHEKTNICHRYKKNIAHKTPEKRRVVTTNAFQTGKKRKKGFVTA
jgi:hypothetical protein